MKDNSTHVVPFPFRSPFALLLVGAVLAIAGIAIVLPRPSTAPEPGPASEPAVITAGGRHTGETGFGWSIEPETDVAITRAYEHAVGRGGEAPDIALVFYNPTHDPTEIRDALLETGAQRILGETTHDGILTPDGYYRSDSGVLGILAADLDSMRVGVGGASFEDEEPAEAAREALRRAIEDSGIEDRTTPPSMILLFVSLPNEEAVLAALAEETGPNVPLIGGTAAGSVNQLSREKISNWSILANEQVIQSGVGLAVFYSVEEFAWSYGGGYRRTTKSGVVTKALPRLILEIDGRPAVDVYDEWLGGKMTRAAERGENVVNFCSLYPICRSMNENNQFIRAWPSNDPEHPRSLRLGSSVDAGDEVFLSEGTWNILLNHFATVPRLAHDSKPGLAPIAGLFLYCGGALACIPEDERPQMAHLVGQSLGSMPWIGVFTWGEQGNIPNVGNLHSNLSSGTVLFPGASVR